MDIDSRENTLDQSKAELKAAQMIKRLQNDVKGPLSGFIKTLIDGQYSKQLTERMCNRANFFFWMSPSHCTLRLMRSVTHWTLQTDKKYSVT